MVPGVEFRVEDAQGLWLEVKSLEHSGPDDRHYMVRQEDGTSTVIFGDGVQGARLPVGATNVRAVYPSGLGRAGDVESDPIDTVEERPPQRWGRDLALMFSGLLLGCALRCVRAE